MRKLLLVAAATAVALIAGTRAARYLQLQRDEPPVMDVTPGYVIPENTGPVLVDTSIGEIMFDTNHEFLPEHRAHHRGNAIFVYFPDGYGFGPNDEHNDYVQRLSLAFLHTTGGRFRMEPVPRTEDGGDPEASAIISAGSNTTAWGKHIVGDEPSTLVGTPLAYQRYMDDGPAPDFDQTVELVTFLIEHDRYVEYACRDVASLLKEISHQTE